MRGRDALIVLVGAGALALLGSVGLLGWAVGHGTEKTRTVTVAGSSASAPSAHVDPAIAAGAHDFVQFACAQCHVRLLRVRRLAQPVIDDRLQLGRGERGSDLRQRRHGERGLGGISPYVPVWGEVVSRRQASDLVAYIRAGLPDVPGAVPVSVPTGQGLEVAGAALYQRYGCINCHGPNGLGGVPNPKSPDKSIPPLSGVAFRRQFNTDAKIIDVIRSGSVIGRAPIVSMPHWGGIIPNQDYKALIAYLRTLKP